MNFNEGVVLGSGTKRSSTRLTERYKSTSCRKNWRTAKHTMDALSSLFMQSPLGILGRGDESHSRLWIRKKKRSTSTGNTNLKKLEKDMGTQVRKVRKENGNTSENLVRFATKRCPWINLILKNASYGFLTGSIIYSAMLECRKTLYKLKFDYRSQEDAQLWSLLAVRLNVNLLYFTFRCISWGKLL